MLQLLLCLFVLLLLSIASGKNIGDNIERDESIHSNSIDYDNQDIYNSERQLSGTCVKTYQASSNCVQCLNSTTVNATERVSLSMGWCSDPSFCFDASISANVNACADKCKGDVYYSNDPDFESECATTTLSVTSIILIFIIVVVCPVCLVGSCVALLCYRCHNAISNKIAIGHDNDLVNTVSPVPVLSVYNGFSNSASSYPMTAVATIQEPPVINVDEINGFKTSTVSVGSQRDSSIASGAGGGSGGVSSRPYSSLAVSSGNRYEAYGDP